jgi:phosphoribosyl-dephospho-CoA transferase
MGLRVHDLVEIAEGSELLSISTPGWATRALGGSRTIVVTRGQAPQGFLYVGIRGPTRGERHAALLREQDVKSRRTPESLAAKKNWNEYPGITRLPALQSLALVADYAAQEHLDWGPAGSVGYQLATGIHTVYAQSDLDVVLRCNVRLDFRRLKRFQELASSAPARVDVILEGPLGGVALCDFLRSPERCLIKTSLGPRIDAFRW